MSIDITFENILFYFFGLYRKKSFSFIYRASLIDKVVFMRGKIQKFQMES